MKKIVVFLVVLYAVSAFSVWGFYSKNTAVNTKTASELTVAKGELIAIKTAFEAEKASREALEKKIVDASVNSTFLALALCPTLETTDKNALCMKNSTEWLSQTIISGTALTSPEAKAKMDALLVALGKKTKPTAKQLYEMLRPIEVDSLKALTESLK